MQTLIIKTQGQTRQDLIEAIELTLTDIKQGCSNGFNLTETGSFTFDLLTEKTRKHATKLI